MKSFKEFLKTSNEFDLDKFKKDCRFVLSQMKSSDDLMYHGTRRYRDNYSIETFKPRSTPRDTPLNVHKQINSYFYDTFGDDMRNRLFVTGELIQAQDYGGGMVQAIFPIGKFEWFCYPNIKDLTGKIGGIKDSATFAGQENLITDKYVADKLILLLKNEHPIINTDFSKAINSRAEIMIKCEKYYQINLDDKLFKNIIKPFLDSQ